MGDKNNEYNYIAIAFYNGIAIGFKWVDYPEKHRSDFVIYIPFVQFAWVRQLIDDDEADDIFNN